MSISYLVDEIYQHQNLLYFDKDSLLVTQKSVIKGIFSSGTEFIVVREWDIGVSDIFSPEESKEIFYPARKLYFI